MIKLERIDGATVYINKDNIITIDVVNTKTKPYLRILFVSGHWVSVEYSDKLNLED